MKKIATIVVCAVGFALLGLNHLAPNLNNNNEPTYAIFTPSANTLPTEKDEKTYDVSILNLPTIFIAILQLAK